ncbi:peptidase M48, partial [bacterium I07]
MSKKSILWSVIPIIVLSLLFIITCAVNPVTGKKEFMLLSEGNELALGQQTDQQIVQMYGLYDDPELNSYINKIGQEMSDLTHRPNLTYQFKVLDTPVINAFAVPGGYIYFTRGILAYLNNEAEFAGVLGHELGHVNARHSAQQYSRAQLAQLGLGIGMVLSEDFRKFAGLASFGVQMLFLRFSRDNERQADDLGVEYSSRSGYDANEMADFFNTLERLNPGTHQSGLPEWFSTHPNPVDRIDAVRRKTAEWQQNLEGQTFAVNQNSYLDQVDQIIYGDDPQQGYVDGKAFYHPALRFYFPIPAGWQVQNTPQQVQVVSQSQDAAMILTLEPGTSPAQAAQNFLTQSSAVAELSGSIRVNGLAAHRTLS